MIPHFDSPSLRIGGVEFPNRVALAPMAGVADLPFRQLCRCFGASITPAEMISANLALWGTEKTKRRLDRRGESGPLITQIAGSCPDQLAAAAQHAVEAGADIIDINMGCPAKKVCRRLAGSALLRDEKLVVALLRRVVSAVNVPVTLKMRTGYSPQRRNGVRIATLAQDEGVSAITVHGRNA